MAHYLHKRIWRTIKVGTPSGSNIFKYHFVKSFVGNCIAEIFVWWQGRRYMEGGRTPSLITCKNKNKREREEKEQDTKASFDAYQFGNQALGSVMSSNASHPKHTLTQHHKLTLQPR